MLTDYAEGCDGHLGDGCRVCGGHVCEDCDDNRTGLCVQCQEWEYETARFLAADDQDEDE